MAILKKRKSVLFAGALILLAAIGVIGMLVNNPVGFIRQIAIIVLVSFILYLIFRRFIGAGPGPARKEQRAFLKAARESRKRNGHKNDSAARNVVHGSLASLRKPKKKTAAHLTVIEGKKGKKKNRASF